MPVSLPDTVLGDLYVLTHLTLTSTRLRFTDEKAREEVQSLT